MFGFGKLVKRHKLSVAEEAELRKWSYNTASFVKDYYRYCESKNIPTIPEDLLEERLERSDNYSNGLRQGIFNKSYDFLITLTNIIVNVFKTILFVT